MEKYDFNTFNQIHDDLDNNWNLNILFSLSTFNDVVFHSQEFKDEFSNLKLSQIINKEDFIISNEL